MHLIPSVKTLDIREGFLNKAAVYFDKSAYDPRLTRALQKLPYSRDGALLRIELTDAAEESYEICIEDNTVLIRGGSAKGAFYGIQTLRQIFKEEKIPHLYIQDQPDFPHRGFYHDVTRGKIPTLESVFSLIDDMAYYKLNSLQLYVEHVYEFKECQELTEKTGCLTADELRQIDSYCKENFIECIPSLSTFGHMYEILNQDKYKHLQVLDDYNHEPNFWRMRMKHHTIDPQQEESFRLVTSLIDQYAPLFESDTFNICCDETFDLVDQTRYDIDPGTLYVEFVKKLIGHVKSSGRKVMMWADILLKYPEVIELLPEDTCFLNWKYIADPPEEIVEKFAKLNRTQIVCPGTSIWKGMNEILSIEEPNICLMAEYGYKHGAVGVLNTNWGDWGHPVSVEMSMYGLVLGAEKSWSVATKPDAAFYESVNTLLYENELGMQVLQKLDLMNRSMWWHDFCRDYFTLRYNDGGTLKGIDAESLATVQNTYREIKESLSGTAWVKDEYRQEMLLAAEGVCIMAELSAKITGIPVTRLTDTEQWLNKFTEKWLQKNKPSELCNLEEMFRYREAN